MAQVIHPLKRLAALVAAAALLGACSLLSPSRVPPPPTAPSPQPPALPLPQEPAQQPLQPPARPPPPVRHVELSPATRALVTLARTQLVHGDTPAASSTLDRALRIEPANALLWIELGRIRLAEGDVHQAEGCGRKALALAAGDPAAQDQAGRLLADVQLAQRRVR